MQSIVSDELALQKFSFCEHAAYPTLVVALQFC